jgi:hypothetical protein
MIPGRRARGRVVRSAGLLLIVIAGVAGLLLPARSAVAYVRYKTTGKIGFFWPQTWVPVTVYPNSMMHDSGMMDMTPDQILLAASGAAAAWSASENICTFLEIQVGSSVDATPTARYDYKNSVIFRTMSWCRTGDPPGTCSYDAAALAITSVFVNTKDGKIRDGDIEVNAKNFIWTDLDLDTSPTAQGKQDLQNALTHEMGHLIGLDHTCIPAGTPGDRPTDNNGLPVPDCETASSTVRATTMFASATPGDVAKRTLEPDDKQAVCEIYPKAKDPMVYPTANTLPPDPGCTCALAPGSFLDRGSGAPAAAVLTVLGAGIFRRRRRGRD